MGGSERPLDGEQWCLGPAERLDASTERRQLGRADRGVARRQDPVAGPGPRERSPPDLRSPGACRSGDHRCGRTCADARCAEFDQVDHGAAPTYLPAQTSHWLTIHTGTVGGPALEQLVRVSHAAAPLATSVHAYHVAREAANMEVALAAGVRPFIDAPNVTGVVVTQSALDGGLLVTPSLDIWHRSTGQAPLADVPATLPPAMVAGIIAHATERLLGGDALPDLRASDGPLASVGQVFDLARDAGVPLRLVDAPGQVAELRLDPDIAQRLVDSVAKGWVAIIPGATHRGRGIGAYGVVAGRPGDRPQRGRAG